MEKFFINTQSFSIKGGEKPGIVRVKYEGGQSRYSQASVDFMIAVVKHEGKDIELYAEMSDNIHDECGTYDTLKSQILSQAIAHGISPNRLEFWFDNLIAQTS